jgi:hypothetical protein
MIAIRQASLQDIPGILKLQALYLFDNLSEKEREDGFVTTPFNESQIADIIAENGLFLALDNKKIIAYMFAGSWKFFSQWPIFAYMISRFPKLKFKDFITTTENSFQYGPVCLHEAYRGTGLLEKLFEAMRIATAPKYPLGITFINMINQRSYRAHVNKLGWAVADEFSFNDRQYYALAFQMNLPQ